MKLQQLSLKNFKGLTDFTINLQGQSATVYGDNATGKTTLYDAFLWLLFDKDSQNKKDFAIKTLDEQGNVVPGIDHEVEGTLEVNGKIITLRKVFAEKWTKKRGSAQAEFTGHTTDYFIDDVPTKKKEYETKTAEICNENIFKLLTSPTYFNEQLHWQDQRNIILQVCGDISDGEVIDNMATLNNKDDIFLLTNIINQRSLEDHKKVIAAERTRINKELEKIPTRIDEVTKGMPEQTQTESKESLQGQIVIKKDEIKKLEQQLSALGNGKAIADKQRRMTQTDTAIITLKNQHREKHENKISIKRQELRKVQDDVLMHVGNINRINKQVEALTEESTTNSNRRQSLRDRWHDCNSQQFTFEQSNACPTCGQSLPESQIQEARKKAQADFNQLKAQQLEFINTEGKKSKAKAEELEKEIAKLNEQMATERKQAEDLKGKVDALQSEINSMSNNTTDFADNPDYIGLQTRKATLLEDIEKLKKGNVAEANKIKDEIEWQNEILSGLQVQLAQVEVAENGKKRIEELKQQERKLAEAFEKLEHELHLTEEFTKSKVRLLEAKINSKFNLARFKMFETQINGGISDVCETTFQGVPYSAGLNNAARINVGIDIINTLAKHYDFFPPIFIDNRESVTKLINTKAQTISLVVSEKDKKLRVEVEGEQENLFKEVG